MNSRPLKPVVLDPDGEEPLTPNHLLLMRGSPNVPPGDFSSTDMYSRKRWRQVQYLANQFWVRWKRLEKFQGKLCFQGKAQSCSNPE